MPQQLALALVFAGLVSAAAQEVSLEYRVKAAYLFNLTRFVDWPASAFANEPSFTVCVAETNPFGPVLSSTLAGETASGRAFASRVVGGDAASCHILFIPRGVSPTPYLRRLGAAPVLTVGESPKFINQGGMVNFVLEDGRVRFEVNPQAAAKSQLKISSRLLQLARVVSLPGGR
jgi:hypothetical protein